MDTRRHLSSLVVICCHQTPYLILLFLFNMAKYIISYIYSYIFYYSDILYTKCDVVYNMYVHKYKYIINGLTTCGKYNILKYK